MTVRKQSLLFQDSVKAIADIAVPAITFSLCLVIAILIRTNKPFEDSGYIFATLAGGILLYGAYFLFKWRKTDQLNLQFSVGSLLVGVVMFWIPFTKVPAMTSLWITMTLSILGAVIATIIVVERIQKQEN